MSVVNSWLQFRKWHDSIMKEATFRAKVAEELCKVGAKKYSKRERLQMILSNNSNKKKAT